MKYDLALMVNALCCPSKHYQIYSMMDQLDDEDCMQLYEDLCEFSGCELPPPVQKTFDKRLKIQ